MAWQKDKLAVRLTVTEELLAEEASPDGNLKPYLYDCVCGEITARVMERFGDDWGKVWIVFCEDLPQTAGDLNWYRIELTPEDKARLIAGGLLTQEEADQPSCRYANVLAKAKVYWDDAIVTDLLPQLAKQAD